MATSASTKVSLPDDGRFEVTVPRAQIEFFDADSGQTPYSAESVTLACQTVDGYEDARTLDVTALQYIYRGMYGETTWGINQNPNQGRIRILDGSYKKAAYCDPKAPELPPAPPFDFDQCLSRYSADAWFAGEGHVICAQKYLGDQISRK